MCKNKFKKTHVYIYIYIYINGFFNKCCGSLFVNIFFLNTCIYIYIYVFFNTCCGSLFVKLFFTHLYHRPLTHNEESLEQVLKGAMTGQWYSTSSGRHSSWQMWPNTASPSPTMALLVQGRVACVLQMWSEMDPTWCTGFSQFTFNSVVLLGPLALDLISWASFACYLNPQQPPAPFTTPTVPHARHYNCLEMATTFTRLMCDRSRRPRERSCQPTDLMTAAAVGPAPPPPPPPAGERRAAAQEVKRR